MSEAQKLREQLEELGFTLLEDSRENASAVLTVEAWVRYSPYALIPIPIRGDDESDASYNSRVEIANESIEDLFAQDARDAVLLEHQDTEPYVEPQPQYDSEEPADAAYEIPDAGDYYAYVPPPVVAAAPEQAVAEPTPAYEASENVVPPAPVEYAEAHRARLLVIRASLITSLEEIDALLGS